MDIFSSNRKISFLFYIIDAKLEGNFTKNPIQAGPHTAQKRVILSTEYVRASKLSH